MRIKEQEPTIPKLPAWLLVRVSSPACGFWNMVAVCFPETCFYLCSLYMKFKTEVSVPTGVLHLQPGDGAVLIGSCFSEGIGSRLQGLKFRCAVNPFGVLYNPGSIAGALELLLSSPAERARAVEASLFRWPAEGEAGLWHSRLFSGTFSNPKRQAALDACMESVERAAALIRSTKCAALLITFGTPMAYIYKDTATVAANCHGVPASEFSTEWYSASRTAALFLPLLERIWQELNEELKVVFTVSPYRYAAYGFHRSAIGKAELLLAVDAIEKAFPGRCIYFPAFEILTDELRDYRFYAPDMLHPSPQAVDYIFEKFCSFALSPAATDFATQWKGIEKFLLHHPLHPENTASRKAAARGQMERINRLAAAYPSVDFNAERKRLEEIINQSIETPPDYEI